MCLFNTSPVQVANLSILKAWLGSYVWLWLLFNSSYLLSHFCKVPIKNIERELICPICKELFTHPLILPCQHSVCHKCVKELLMLNQDDSFSVDAGSECSNPGSPRSRVPSPSMERLDKLVRSGTSTSTVWLIKDYLILFILLICITSSFLYHLII